MQAHDKTRIQPLLIRYLQGICSEEERKEAEHLLRTEPVWKDAYDRLSTDTELVRKYRFYRSMNPEKAFHSFCKQTGNKLPQRRPTVWIRLSLSVAACLLLCLSVHYYMEKQELKRLTEVAPRHQHAILTSQNGEHIILSEAPQGSESSMIDRNGIKAQYTKEGMNVLDGAASALHTLTVPRGAEYRLTLSDGTTVHLNAESSITFPCAFNDTSREVTLTGEAYFHVRKTEEARPFVVHAGPLKIKQYGTEFNINSQDTSVEVTLVKGSIGVSTTTPDGKEPFITIRPSEQAIYRTSHPDKLVIRKINTELATGWHQGLFLFENEPLDQVIEELERWYDTRISLDGTVQDVRITGTVSRNEKLHLILEAICRVNNLAFHAEKGNLMISRP